MNSPLPEDQRGGDGTLPTLKELIPRCDGIGCGYHRGSLDSDYMPAGCIVLVCALMGMNTERKDANS